VYKYGDIYDAELNPTTNEYKTIDKVYKYPKYPNECLLLDCNETRLSDLGILPPNLQILLCNKNKLVSLPELPETLIELWCNFNDLVKLPEFPDILCKIYCESNPIKYVSAKNYSKMREIYLTECHRNNNYYKVGINVIVEYININNTMFYGYPNYYNYTEFFEIDKKKEELDGPYPFIPNSAN
jgi:Leucine-rich repeat (LRR) protein